MLTRIRIQDFKAIADLDLTLDRFTAFVGPNGAGKTSVLECVHLLTGGDPDPGLSLSQYRRKGAAGLAAVTIETDQLETVVVTLLSHQNGDNDDVPFKEEQRAVILRARSGQRPPPDTSSHPRSIFLRLSPRQLAMPSFSDDQVPWMREDGTGLASVLSDLAASEPELLQEITDQVRAVLPMVRRLRTERARLTYPRTKTHEIDGKKVEVQHTETAWGHRLLLDTASGAGIAAGHISEGTLLIIGLFTQLCGRQRPDILLLDDIDRALHPGAQIDLMRSLRRMLVQRPELQILTTTHSPYLLDELRFEEVRVLTTTKEGLVIGAPLDQHPDLDKWRDSVRPGELWTANLESWIAERKQEAAG